MRLLACLFVSTHFFNHCRIEDFLDPSSCRIGGNDIDSNRADPAELPINYPVDPAFLVDDLERIENLSVNQFFNWISAHFAFITRYDRTGSLIGQDPKRA